MKESKFIELLNLYVDHQISASDAALLEAEIQRNPERRKIYREYCQMQKACAILAENFRPQTQPSGGQVVEFPSRRSRWNAATYVMGAMAAAACVALVVVNRNGLAESGSTQSPAAMAAVEEAPISDVVAQSVPASTPVAAPDPVPARQPLQPVFAGLVSDAANDSSARPTLNWVSQVNLQPVAIDQIDQFRFETKSTFHTENRMLQSPFPSAERESEVLPVAWRFQR